MGDKKTIPLKSVVKKFINGGTPKTDIPRYWQGTTPWVTGSDFTHQKLDIGRRFVSHEAIEKTSTNVIPQGNLLLLSRTGVGKMTVAPCDIAISQDITGLIVDQKQCDPQYLFFQLEAKSHKLKRWAQGTSIRGIERKDLEIFPIERPSLEQQNRIAKLLDSLDTVIEKTRGAVEQLRRVAKAHIEAQLCSTNHNTYRALKSYLLSPIKNGVSVNSTDAKQGDILLTLGAVTQEGFDPTAFKNTPAAIDLQKNALLQAGDLVVGRSNTPQLVGLAGLYQGVPSKCYYPDLLMRVRVNTKIAHPKYIEQVLLSNHGRHYMCRMSKGTSGSMKKIDKTILEDFPIIEKPLSEQQTFVENIQILENRKQTLLAELDSLTRLKTALSQKIFN